MTKHGLAGILCFALLTIPALPAQKRKSKKPDEDPKPQILAPLPEPPEAVAVETGRLTFQVSPLSDKGLLSQQVRDALKAIARLNHGATIVKLRAFVAGSGDLRRVKEIVAAELTERKQPLPAISTVQVGALPMTGAQVVLEAISSENKIANPNGLAFASAAPVQQLQDSLAGAGVNGSLVLRVTCFLGSLDGVAQARSAVASAFPAAVVNFVQSQRLAADSQADCEAVGQVSLPHPQSGVAFANTPKLVLTGAQLVFRDQDADVRLAFQRLLKAIARFGATPQDVVWSGAYVLSKPDAARIGAIAADFLSPTPPGGVMQVEGLPSADATAAIEFIAAGH